MYSLHSARTRTALLVLAMALVIATDTARGGPVLYCSDGPNIDLIADGCISGSAPGYPGGGDGIYSNAGGGDFKAAVEVAIAGATGLTFDLTLLGKSDEGAPFSYSPDGAVSLASSFSGSWTQTSGAGTVRFVTVKAANSFALFELSPASGTGAYSTMGILSNGGQQPTVSHLSFWSTVATDVNEVPEPGAVVLLGSGVIGLLWLRKRKAKSTAHR